MKQTNWWQNLSQSRILVLGDSMIDRYIWGNVNRISPEAPVPILQWKSNENRLGGAANVALNATGLGVQVALCSLIGNDTYGNLFLQLCQKRKIQSNYITQNESRPTSVKTRILSGSQHLLRVDHEIIDPISESLIAQIKENFIIAVEKFQPDIIIVQDYNKGLLQPELIDYVLYTAYTKGIFLAVDPKKDFFFHYKEVDLFKPNVKELQEAYGKPIETSSAQLANATQEVQAAINAKHILVTLSDKGIFYFQKDGTYDIASTTARAVVDVCGAGDAVITLASIALQAGVSIEETAAICNIAGGQVCENIGVSTINPQKLSREWFGKELSIEY